MPLTAVNIIRLLQLQPHPEGGHSRETFRDSRTIDGKRAVSTAIYFLLARGERSHWHRVDAVETWHWHAGAPLQLDIHDGAERSSVLTRSERSERSSRKSYSLSTASIPRKPRSSESSREANGKGSRQSRVILRVILGGGDSLLDGTKGVGDPLSRRVGWRSQSWCAVSKKV